MAAAAGIDVLPSNDFSLYDHVLDTCVLVGAIPERFADLQMTSLERYFAMARGSEDVRPLAMTKWFDSNYHNLVPEISEDTPFALCPDKPLAHFREALEWGFSTRPTLLGPVSFLLLAKPARPESQPLEALENLLPVYEQLLCLLHAAGVQAVQIDEPCLVGDLSDAQLVAIERSWARLTGAAPALQLTLATYFGGLGGALERVLSLPAHEFHLDLVRAPEQLDRALGALGPTARLSLGVIDARNVWASDLQAIVGLVKPALLALGADRVRLAPSCSLLHVPYSVTRELRLDSELRLWLAFGEREAARTADGEGGAHLHSDPLASGARDQPRDARRSQCLSRARTMPRSRLACTAYTTPTFRAARHMTSARSCKPRDWRSRICPQLRSALSHRLNRSEPHDANGLMGRLTRRSTSTFWSRRSARRSSARSTLVWTCSCTASLSATIWSPTSPNSCGASPSPSSGGCSPTAHGA